MPAKLAAEFIGTFWVVLRECGSAVLPAAFRHLGSALLAWQWRLR
jgi:aquaporin Z